MRVIRSSNETSVPFLQEFLKIYMDVSALFYSEMEEVVRGFRKIMDKVSANITARRIRRKQRKFAMERAESLGYDFKKIKYDP